MASDMDIKTSKCRIFHMRSLHDKHHEELQITIDAYDKLLDDYQRLQSDYEEEKEAREKYKRLSRNQHVGEADWFVIVLVDGDGYLVSSSASCLHFIDVLTSTSSRRVSSWLERTGPDLRPHS